MFADWFATDNLFLQMPPCSHILLLLPFPGYQTTTKRTRAHAGGNHLVGHYMGLGFLS